jgi:hypothetical protein
MLRILGVALAVGFVWAAPDAANATVCPLLLGASEEGACPSYPSLSARFGAGVEPKELPKDNMAPAALNLSAEISTADGTHPSALRELTIDLDRNIAIDAEGVPVCRLRNILGQPPGELRRVCRTAIVGGGKADLEFAVPEEKSIKGSSTLILYNSGIADGVTTLHGVAFINAPVPQAIVISIKIKKIDKGGGGLEAVVRLPMIAGGSGSLIGLRLRLKRLFSFEGKRKSYATARCPKGHLRTAITALFKNEAESPDTPSQTILKGTVVSPCASKH